jgi:tetratricopeptide (TPR) repeat protein
MAVASLERVPLGFRLENIPVAYVAYLSKFFWPANLAVIYPLPADLQLPALAVAAAVAVLIFVSVAVWLGRNCAPYLPVGWLWFLGTLVPVIGLVQVGTQALADRYAYLPATGLFIMAAFGARDLASRFHLPKMVVATTSALILVACLKVTENQLRYWRDSESLFRHALAVTKENYTAHINLGVALELEGKLDEAVAEYHAAETIAPDRYQIHNNLGNCLDHQGKPIAALAEYHEAVRLNPTLPELHNSCGIVLAELGRYDESLVEFTNATRLDPAYPWAHFEMAKTLLKQGRDTEAIDQFREALRLDPENFQILAYTARVLAAEENPNVRDGRTAFTFATKANNLTGGMQPLVLDALGMACAETGDFTNAADVTQKALDLATAAKMKEHEAIRLRFELYKNNRPWRESFLATNAPTELLQKN